jgi:hypothetical protein
MIHGSTPHRASGSPTSCCDKHSVLDVFVDVEEQDIERGASAAGRRNERRTRTPTELRLRVVSVLARSLQSVEMTGAKMGVVLGRRFPGRSPRVTGENVGVLVPRCPSVAGSRRMDGSAERIPDDALDGSWARWVSSFLPFRHRHEARARRSCVSLVEYEVKAKLASLAASSTRPRDRRNSKDRGHH